MNEIRSVLCFSIFGMMTMTACGTDIVYVADESIGETLSDESDREQGTDSIVDTDDVTSSDSRDSSDSDTIPPDDTETAADSDTIPPDDTETASTCEVPDRFSWTSSEALILPSRGYTSIKDPTVVRFNDSWLIYATTIDRADDLSITYLNVTDWDQAETAEQTPVSTNEDLSGYKAAPQLFYFAPQDLWYLVYQKQDPAYSTTHDPTDVLSWSAPTRFMPMPSTVTDSDGFGIDYWVICDDTDCYLFFSGDNSVLYRARTTKEAFPEGFEGTTEIAMKDESNTNKLYDACNVYKLAGTDRYLLIVSAIGAARYFQSWTSDRLDGDWIPLADTESNSFASINNVTGADWSQWGISHGEMLRTNPDETMTIDTCNMQYLFSGLKQSDADPETEYYCLGLLTPAK